jgi:NTE family protein
MARMFSPYELNPLNYNPLESLLAERLDFDAVCDDHAPHLFVCATNVRSGKIKVFQGQEISTEAILASTCLPTLFQAVEIEDPETGRREAYWDGGYTGNPALFPLFYNTKSRDIVIAHINPIFREDVPRSARDIMNRVNEISFNSSLIQELRSIAFVRRLIREGRVPRAAFKDVLIHSVMDDETMTKLGVATKLRPDWTLLQNLKQAGREAMDRFLRAHWSDLGARPSVDLAALYG